MSSQPTFRSVATQVPVGSGLLLLTGTGLIYYVALRGKVVDSGNAALFLVTGLSVAVAGLVYPVASIRCSVCRDPWLWRAMNTQIASGWLKWLFDLRACPNCEALERDQP